MNEALAQEEIRDFAADDGSRLRIHLHGAGPTLLFLHGWTLDRHSFDAQAPLADAFRLARFDRRGCGESTARPSLASEPGDIAAIISGLDTGPVHLLGVSQGARLALRVAVLYPDLLRTLTVQGVILDDFIPGVDDDAPLPIDHYRELVKKGELETMRREWLAHPMLSSDDLSLADRNRLAASVSAYSGRDLVDEQALVAAAVATPTALASMRTPTLVMTGERESLGRKAHAAKLVACARDAREVVLPACGHLCNLGQPDAYNRTLRAFLEDHPD
ncbi:MAG: alpha/beta hydrolase [Halieaceae bacterium]|jgi:pimeloyl-ACP methyl ester carboxylesterase|nr:alpha/beta hydrolase [Halieaceae bacterium]